MAQRLGLSPTDAEDVAFRVLYIAANHLHELPEEFERPFIVKTACFVVAKTRRAEARRRSIESLVADPPEVAVEGSEPDETAKRRSALYQLDRILGQLPDDLRMIFVLFEIEGFSQSEICEALGIPQGIVASRIRRAKSMFVRFATLNK